MGIGLLAGTLAAHAQPKVHRVGVVSVLHGSPEPATVRAFRQELRQLGYVEGKNVLVEIRYAEGRSERLPGFFAELINLKVDVLLTGSVVAALAAKKATTSVPIVVAGTPDLVSPGIVTNLARPGGNVTGTTFSAGSGELAGKWVELLKEVVPSASRIAVLFNSADPQTAGMLNGVRAAASALKLAIAQFDAASDATLEKALAGIAASGAQALIILPTSYFGANRKPLIGFATERRLPAIYFFNLFPADGGLMSYGGSVEDSYRRAATYVDKILKGAKPGDLPVDQATKFELVVNVKAAKAIGLELPRAFLLRADRIIE